MDKGDATELSKYRFEMSQSCLKSAKTLLEIGDYKGAANRSYYSIFHAIRSILALDKVEFKRHSGNISYFRQNYIKSGKFDVEISEMLSSASEVRNGSDYNDFYVISKEEVENQIKNAEKIAEDVRDYLSRIQSPGSLD